MHPITDPLEKIVIIAGMPRSGTTYVYHSLNRHPDAFISHRKEINFVACNFHKGGEWYGRQFKGKPKNRIGFDISPFYFILDECVDQIERFSSEAKVILLVRDPVAWVASFYKQILSFDSKPPDFEEFFESYNIKCMGHFHNIKLKDFNVYERIKLFMAKFKGRQLILNYDLLKKDPLEFLGAIEKFSGLNPYFKNGNIIQERINAGDRKRRTLLNRLMANSKVVSLAENFLPKPLVLLGKRYLQAGGRGKNDYEDERNMELARGYLKGQSAQVKELFCDSDVLYP